MAKKTNYVILCVILNAVRLSYLGSCHHVENASVWSGSGYPLIA